MSIQLFGFIYIVFLLSSAHQQRSKPVMKLFVWICISVTLLGNVKSAVRNVTACYYNESCSLYSLNCLVSHKIQVIAAEYRYKTSSCTTLPCNQTQSCCFFRETDCTESFSDLDALTLYQRCSVKESCGPEKAPPPRNSNCSTNVQSSRRRYISVQYECIVGNKFIDICHSPTQGRFLEVNVMLFNQTQFRDGSSKCTCHVESQETVNYQLVDIRFFKAGAQNGTYKCTNGTLTINGLSIKCNGDNTSFIYYGSGNFSGVLENNSKMELSYSENDRPAMIWIYLNASMHNFTIHCVNDSFTTPTTIIVPTSEMKTTSSKDYTANNPQSNTGSLSVVLGAVGAVIVIIAVAITTFILYKRRCHKHVEKEAAKVDLPNEQSNHIYLSLKNPEKSFKAIEKSNYDTITNESVGTYSKPLNKMKDGVVPTDENKHIRNVSSDKYDIIELEMQCANKAPKYDSLQSVTGKVQNDTYSHTSSQSKGVPSVTPNEYSHCKFNRNEPSTESHPNKAVVMNKALYDCDYSHVALGLECKNESPASTNEEDPYMHINFDKTPNPTGNEMLDRGGIMPNTEKDCPEFNGILSDSAGRDKCSMYDVSTEVSCSYQQNQGINAVSSSHNYMEFRQVEINGTPRSNDQQHTAFIKNTKDNQPNEKHSKNRIHFGIEESNPTAQDVTNTSDYELAKSMA